MRDKDPPSDSDDDPPQNIIDQPPESSALLPFRVAVHTCCLTLRCVEVPPGTVAAVFPSEQGARRGHCRCAFSAVLLSSAQLVRSLTFMAPAPVPATPPCFPRTWGCRRLSSPQPVVSGAAVLWRIRRIRYSLAETSTTQRGLQPIVSPWHWRRMLSGSGGEGEGDVQAGS